MAAVSTAAWSNATRHACHGILKAMHHACQLSTNSTARPALSVRQQPKPAQAARREGRQLCRHAMRLTSLPAPCFMRLHSPSSAARPRLGRTQCAHRLAYAGVVLQPAVLVQEAQVLKRLHNSKALLYRDGGGAVGEEEVADLAWLDLQGSRGVRAAGGRMGSDSSSGANAAPRCSSLDCLSVKPAAQGTGMES